MCQSLLGTPSIEDTVLDRPGPRVVPLLRWVRYGAAVVVVVVCFVVVVASPPQPDWRPLSVPSCCMDNL